MPVLPQADRWFPSIDSTTVVGRVIDVECDVPETRNKSGEKLTEYRPVMQSKVTGSDDISAQAIKPHNEKELKKRFPGAWEHYQAQRDALERGTQVVEPPIKGTPIEEGELFNNERIAWFKLQGFYTMEQVAAISDTTIENMGRSGSIGGRDWRKKAKRYLESKQTNGGYAPQQAAGIGQ